MEDGGQGGLQPPPIILEDRSNEGSQLRLGYVNEVPGTIEDDKDILLGLSEAFIDYILAVGSTKFISHILCNTGVGRC